MTSVSRKKICFTAMNIWPVLADARGHDIAGGMEVQISILAKALVRAGFDVSIITQNYGQPDAVTVDGIKVFRTHPPVVKGIPGVKFFHPRISAIWNALGRADADIYVQRSAAYLSFVVGLYCKLHCKHFVYSCASNLDVKADETGKLFPRRGGWRDHRLHKIGLGLANAIVAQHRGQVADCLRWYGKNAIEIPNCYAPDPGASNSPDGDVLWVATIKKLKRPDVLLSLAKQLPSVPFRIVGGPAGADERYVYDETRYEANELGNIEFIGFVPYAEVGGQFDRARVLVNTSDFEGFPNTFLQAWARGIPTVSFIDCGAKDDEGTIGYVCRSEEEMRQVIDRLMHNNDEWIRASSRARAYFEANHSVDIAVKKYEQLFHTLTDQSVAAK